MSRSEPLLPKVAERRDYVSLQQETTLWLPAMRVICQRHNLSIDGLLRLGDGTNVVFAAGVEDIIKLFPPYWQREVQADRSVAEFVYSKLGITTPKIRGHGELEGWPYLVMSRLQGSYLSDVWDTMDYQNRLDIVIELGELLARLHTLPIAGFNGFENDWKTIIQQRVSDCQQHHRTKGVSEYWLRQIPAYLAQASPLYPTTYTPALLSGDLHQYHLLVNEVYGCWHLCGFFDFDDARIGFHEYDLASAGLFMMLGRPQLLRAFLGAYGYANRELNEKLSARLMAYTLLYRYRDLNWILEELVATRLPSILTNYTLSIPSTIGPYLHRRRFPIQSIDGSTEGTVVVSNRGMSWGYGQFLSRHGADEDDILVVEFDLIHEQVTLELETEEFLDEPFVLSQESAI
jgi:hygromycin-B 7''-O-kinase